MSETVLFQAIQFSKNTQNQRQKQFYFKQFLLALVRSLLLFDPEIGPYQVLQLRIP